MISVTPNPAMNDIYMRMYSCRKSSYVSMRVMNKDGQSVIRKVVEGVPGLNTFTVDGSSKLEPGSYILELIVNSNERMLVKLIKE